MALNEASIQFLEAHIPELAEIAVKQAYWQALASGSSVLQCEDGVIYEIFPDGNRQEVKRIPPMTPATIGQRIDLK